MSARRLQLARRADWDQIRRLYVSGMTIVEVAKELGVNPSTVAVVINPDYRKKKLEGARLREYTETCVDCGASCTGVRCRSCSAKQSATSVREDTLRCVHCRLWLPDEQFYRDKRNRHRRYLSQRCKSCNSIVTKEQRQRRKER